MFAASAAVNVGIECPNNIKLSSLYITFFNESFLDPKYLMHLSFASYYAKVTKAVTGLFICFEFDIYTSLIYFSIASSL